MYKVKFRNELEFMFSSEPEARSFFYAQTSILRGYAFANEDEAIEAHVYRSEYSVDVDVWMTRDGKVLKHDTIMDVKQKGYERFVKDTRKTYASHLPKSASAQNDSVIGDLFVKAFPYIIFYGIPTLLFGWGLASLRSCQDDYKQELKTQSYYTYATYNPAIIVSCPSLDYDIDVTDSKDTTKTITIPRWTDHGGDKAKCREAFLFAMNSLYDVKKYDHSKEKVTVKIEGNTLWMYSFSFDQDVNRMYVIKDADLQREFKDCGFHKVNLSRCDAGGQQYWTVYTDNNVKDVKTQENEQKLKAKRGRASGGDTYDDAEERFQEILSDHGIEEADLDMY